ncbi:hypothetical protein D910_11810 [Dendroctonus ponderosae]
MNTLVSLSRTLHDIIEKRSIGRGGTETDLAPVLKALNDAVTRTFPMIKYTPISRQEKMKAFVADYFPRAVYDLVYS